MYESADSFYEEPSLLLRIFMGFARLLLFPMSILNFVALPVGAIWLCVLGSWKLVILAFLSSFLSPKIIGLVTLPSAGLQVAAAKTIQGQRSFLRWFLCGLLLTGSYYYFALVFGAWGLISFSYIIRYASANALIPSLLLAFAVGIWPEQAMADMKNPSIQENLCLLCGITEMVAMSILRLLHVGDLRWYLSVCVISIMIFVPIQVWVAWIGLKQVASSAADELFDDSMETRG
jgi:hypothetical protein